VRAYRSPFGYSNPGGLDLTGMDGGDRASTPTPDTGTLRTDYTGDSFPRVFKVGAPFQKFQNGRRFAGV